MFYFLFMKTIKIIFIILVIIAVAVLIYFIFPRKIVIPEAYEIILKYNYHDKNIYEIIYDENEIIKLTELFHGKYAFKDNPSCGFSEDISITFVGKDNIIMLCPALDKCNINRIGTTNKYVNISEENRRKLELFLEKYGFKFPAV